MYSSGQDTISCLGTRNLAVFVAGDSGLAVIAGEEVLVARLVEAVTHTVPVRSGALLYQSQNPSSSFLKGLGEILTDTQSLVKSAHCLQ